MVRSIKFWAAGLLLACSSLSLGGVVLPAADPLVLKPYYPTVYQVQKGDTLWDISSLYLRDPWLWPELWYYNPDIQDPHLIYPGDELVLQWIDGRPRLVRTKVLLKPGVKHLAPRLRVSSKAVPAVRTGDLGKKIRNSRLIDKGVADAAAYVLQGEEGRTLTGSGHTIAARGNFNAQKIFDVLRVGQTWLDPASHQLLGVQAQVIGVAKHEGQVGDIARLSIHQSTKEVRPGDILLPPSDVSIPTELFPKWAPPEIKGIVLGVSEDIQMAGLGSVIVVNQGLKQGLKPGYLIGIYQEGRRIRDPKAGDYVTLPKQNAGTAMIVQSENLISYALIIQSSAEIKEGDIMLGANTK